MEKSNFITSWQEVVKLWLNATILTFWMVVMIPWA